MAKTKLNPKSSHAVLSKKTARRKKAPSEASKLQGPALERAIERFQAESDTKKAHKQWVHIERSVFGVEFED